MLVTDTLLNALEILLPRCCLVCERPVLKSFVCLRCTPCANPTLQKLDDWPKLPFRSLQSLWLYQGNERHFITAMKYRPSLTLAKLAGQQLAEIFVAQPRYDLIVPIPSSRHSFRKRLFNQAAVLAAKVARGCDTPWSPNALKHLGYADPQASLSVRERFSNVRNSFAAETALVSNKSILLIDDVVTTGATIASASKTLLSAGAKQVQVAVLARSESWIACLAILEQKFGTASKST